MKNITRIVFLFVLLNAVVYATVQAQIIINNGGRIQIVNNNGQVQNDVGPDNNLIQAPRETIQRLKTAQALMADKRYSEAVRILWDILRNEEDAFIRINVDKSVVEEAAEKPAENEESKPNAPQPEKTPPPAGPTTLISLKTYIQNILAQAPEEARHASELIVGTEAQKALDAALESGSLDRLLSVSRDYFHTEAGYKASFLAALILLNDGQATSAASLFDLLANAPGVRQKFEPAFSVLWLNSLILSGQDVERRELVTQLRQRLARVDWSVENKQMTGFDNLEQLEKYLAEFADKMQKSECSYPSAEPFTLPRWTAPTYTNPTLEALVQTFNDNETKSAAAAPNQYNSLMSAFEPAISGQKVFFRTQFGLTAVDLQTGKRLWDSSADFSPVIQRQWDNNGEYERKAMSQFLYYAIALRSKFDFTYGALRADEKFVYAIEDIWKDRIQQGVLSPRSSTGITISRSSSGTFTQNRLAAYDVNTGKLKWHVGSATVNYGSGADSSLDSTSFLGAPLILEGKLYIIGETAESAVVFYELDSATGKVLWSQTLGSDAQNSLADRMYNLTPIYQNGILVCPISGSTLVCIDLRQRRLLWGFNTPNSQTRRSGFFVTGSSDLRYELSNMNNAYNNSSVQKGYQLCLLDNKAFYTPVRSSGTFVINLLDGSLDEKLTDQKTSYVPMSVSQNEAIILTPSQVSVITGDLDSINHELEQLMAKRRELEQQLGKLPPQDEQRKELFDEFMKLTNRIGELEKQTSNVFTAVPFPDSARLIGRPFEYDGSWFIPLNNNTLAEFNVSKREFVKSIKAPAGKSFGTVCLNSDKVFSQNYDRLDCYDVKQFVEQQLQKDSDSVRALLAAGYMAWDRDDISTAAAKFRLAADKAPKSCLPILKALAVYVLKKDYRQFEPLLETFKPAFDSEQDRLIIAQFKIDSCLLQNNIQECLATLEPVMDDALKSNLKSCPIDLINEDASIERSVWIGSILEKIYKSASDEQKLSIEQWAAKRLEAPAEERTTDWLTRQLDFFRILPVAAELQKELYQAYVSSNMLPLAELVLRQQRMAPGATPEQIAGSLAQQAIMIQKSAPEDAAKLFKQINRLYPGVACCDGKTADEYVKSLGDSSPVYKEYSFNFQWPQNEIDVALSKDKRQAIIQTGSDNKKQFFNENAFLDGETIRKISSSQQTLFLFDRYGRNKAVITPEKNSQQSRYVYYRSDSDINYEAPWSSAEHLFFIPERNGQMSAINMFVRPGLLWSKDFEQEKLGDEDHNPYVLIRKANQPDSRNGEINKFSGVYGNIVIVQLEDGAFAALDAATGRMRWSRKFEKHEAIVYIDNEYLYTSKNYKTLDSAENVFYSKPQNGKTSFPEVRGEQYSIYTGNHERTIRVPNPFTPTKSPCVICIESTMNATTNQQSQRLKLCSLREQKILWELETSAFATTTYVKKLNCLCRNNIYNGAVQIVDCETGRIILEDIFEVMTQEERDKIVEDVKKLKTRIEEENKKYEEEEKNDPKKREERIRRQSREGRTEDLLPENYNESMAKNFFDGVDVLPDVNSPGDFYLIVRSNFGYTRKQRNSCKQFSPTRGLHLPKAKIYKFNRDGKPLWKEPLLVSDQYLYYDLPCSSPFLVLGCNRQVRENNTSRSDYEFLFVDKATGRVWKYQGKNPIGAFQIVCDPDKKTVEVVISNKESLILSYTDLPIPSDAPMELQLLTDEEKAKLKEEKAKQEKEKEQLEKEKEKAGEDDPFA
ncbi:MAG: PQQ-like beta-propeller repeat protein [Thermoguttaceae bacterium]|nr:PQQ-like beta-propeller repeat protein [Thermoguttaceae bacterium]